MKKLINDAIAGVVATIILSLMMLIKGKAGVMPGLDIISMVAGMMGGALFFGWVMHFMSGVGYGVVFHLTYDKLPTNSLIIKGVILGVVGWLVMMLMLMPMAGAGLFGMKIGFMAPIMTRVLHAIFGAVLRFVYNKLPQVNKYKNLTKASHG
jgi:hypothetical protein